MKDKFMKNGVFSLEYDKETLRDMVLELQEESQKQKEVIDKAIEYIKENCAQSYCLPPKIYDVRCLDLNALLEILEDKEV